MEAAGDSPGVILSDQDKGFAAACERVFPGVPHLPCTWHVNQHVNKEAQQAWKNDAASEERVAEFMGAWQPVVIACTEQVFWAQWEGLKRGLLRNQAGLLACAPLRAWKAATLS